MSLLPFFLESSEQRAVVRLPTKHTLQTLLAAALLSSRTTFRDNTLGLFPFPAGQGTALPIRAMLRSANSVCQQLLKTR